MSDKKKDGGCGCPERAEKALKLVDRYNIPLPNVVRGHFKKVAARTKPRRERPQEDA